ncbi:MAG: PDZ domain-containing protein [Akkermansia sp.]|nr:PDZ domain-containing protein [Akkermansia sp.]
MRALNPNACPAMYRTFALMMLCAALAACKPTPRTAPDAHRTPPPAEQTPAPEPQTPATPEEPPAPAPQPAPTPTAEPANALLKVHAARQEYALLQPWEKKTADEDSALGVYLGDGRVLTVAEPLRAATYVELSLPDDSRSVPARVLKRDDDLNLALLTVEHEADASIFDTRTALALGEPMALGAEAELAGLVRGLTPVHIPVLVQGVNGEVPHLTARTAAPAPEGHDQGAPVMQGGKLVGLSLSFEADALSLELINAELIARFLDEAHRSGTPVLGLRFTPLDDPVLRRYLELPEEQSGLYVSAVIPGSAAENAGIIPGDVIIAIDGMAVDAQGRCRHPLYGLYNAAALLRIAKPLGEALSLNLYRHGEQLELPVPLNRDIAEHGLHALESAGSAPRYILWGGLVFQPLTESYLNAVRQRSNGDLPLPFLRLTQREKELAESGEKEPIGLTIVIPTPATLGYDRARFAVVKAVNGKPVHDLAELAELLDEPTADDVTEIRLDTAPYSIYIDRSAAETANDLIRRRGIPVLRNL